MGRESESCVFSFFDVWIGGCLERFSKFSDSFVVRRKRNNLYGNTRVGSYCIVALLCLSTRDDPQKKPTMLYYGMVPEYGTGTSDS